MSTLWDAAQKIEEIGFKVHSVRCVVEMVAEAISTDTESGSLWAVSEMLEHLSDKLNDQSKELVQLYKRGEKGSK